jgi:hypothetical protein
MKFQNFEKPTTDTDFLIPKAFDQTLYKIVTFSKEPIPDKKKSRTYNRFLKTFEFYREAIFEKITVLYKVLSKVVGDEVSESVIGFSKSLNFIFEIVGGRQYQYQSISNVIGIFTSLGIEIRVRHSY